MRKRDLDRKREGEVEEGGEIEYKRGRGERDGEAGRDKER